VRAVAQAQMGGHAAGGIPVINEHVGERLKMYWPEEGGWFEAIISDYNAVTDEHCLTYHINTPEETFEWIHLKARAARWQARAAAAAPRRCFSLPLTRRVAAPPTTRLNPGLEGGRVPAAREGP